MKSVLLGIDFLNLEGQVKFLELNTDVYIPNISYNSFDFTALETYLTTNLFSKFRIIYKDEYTADEFINRLESMCDSNSITFEKVPVAIDSITIPFFEDADTDFTLRISYDITALIDDVYCRDKKELLSLIFNNNQTDLIPKTYFQKDGTTFDNVSNLIDNGIHPNLIIKKSLPDFDKISTPKFYKLTTETEVTDVKAAMDVDLHIAQEFQFNSNNLYNGKIRDHIRYWLILCSDTTTTIDFGGYISANALPLNSEYISYSGSVLNNDSRILYFSNPSRTGVGIPSTYETIKIVDGQEVTTTLSEIELGDVVKAITLPGLDDTSNTQGAMYWVYTGSYNDMSYTTASVVVKMNETIDEWFIKVNYDIAGESNYMLVNLVELVLTCDVDGNNLTFKSASELTSGDYIVVSNTIIANVTSITYEKFSGDVVKLNIEPADVFISGTNTNGIGHTIANNFIIYNYKS
jgi:hypothetical protein